MPYRDSEGGPVCVVPAGEVQGPVIGEVLPPRPLRTHAVPAGAAQVA